MQGEGERDGQRQVGLPGFVRDPKHWLFQLDPHEWIRAGMGELERAEKSLARRNLRGWHAGLRRAAGMALNGVLIVAPNPDWGRSYMDHLRALAASEDGPERVRKAAALLVDTPLPGAEKLVTLRLTSVDKRLLEATKDVMAHAYALVRRSETT